MYCIGRFRQQDFVNFSDAHRWSWVFRHGTGYNEIFWENDNDFVYHYLSNLDEYLDVAPNLMPGEFIDLVAGSDHSPPKLQAIKTLAREFDLLVKSISQLKEKDPNELVTAYDCTNSEIYLMTKSKFFDDCVPF